MDLSFLVFFLLKSATVSLQRWLKTRHFMYPCRLFFIWSHVHSAYLISTKAAGTPGHGRKVFSCVSPDSCCWVASLYDGWGRGRAEVRWGEVHTYSTSTHAHTGAHTHMHTPRQLHSSTFYHYRFWALINNWKKNNYNKSKLCLRTHWMRWLVVLLSKHTQEDPQLHASSYHHDY